jgi:hypothetical protein
MADPAVICQFWMRCNIGTQNPAIVDEFSISTEITSVSQFKDFDAICCKDAHNKRNGMTFIGPAMVG